MIFVNDLKQTQLKPSNISYAKVKSEESVNEKVEYLSSGMTKANWTCSTAIGVLRF